MAAGDGSLKAGGPPTELRFRHRVIVFDGTNGSDGTTMQDDDAIARDAGLRGAIDAGFQRSQVVPAERIAVKVRAGWVTLRGDVDWEYQRYAAERVVRSLPAVIGVTNLVRVDAGAPAAAARPSRH